MAILKATQNNATAISNVYEQENGFPAAATVTFSTNPADGNTITLNGTIFTFRNTPSLANDVQIGADISASINNLLTEALPAVATYKKNGTDSFDITYATVGTVGNSYTIACDFTSVPATLAGGSDNPDGDWVDNTPSIDYKLPEIVVDNTTTTNTALIEYNTPIAQGDNVRLYNSIDGLVDGSLGAVNTTALIDKTGIHDIFGDGSCVATYNLDGNANDLGGNYNGTATDVTYSAGKFGQAAVFNGSTSYISQTTAMPITASYTISCWFKTNDNSLSSQTLIYINDGTDKDYNWIRLYTDNVGQRGTTTSAKKIQNNIFYFALLSVENGVGKLYIDGVYDSSYTLSAFTLQQKLWIGADRVGDFPFNGSIDQVRIFNRALTPTEVNTLYNEQLTKYTADISALGLTNPPTKAYKDVPVSVATVTEANANRCVAQDEVLTKVSSTLTEFVGTNPNSGLITTGDSIQLDGTTDVVITNVVETDVSTDVTGLHDIFGDGSAVATYQLNGDATDLGGNYNGISGSPTYGTGKFGQAGVFDGSNGAVIGCGKHSELYFNTVTISCWAKLPSVASGQIVGYFARTTSAGSSTNSGIQISVDANNNLKCGYNIKNNENTTDSNGNNYSSYSAPVTTPITKNSWVHIVVVVDTNTIEVFLDNVSKGSNSSTQNIQYSDSLTYAGELCIGGQRQDSNKILTPFNGSIDQVRIFNRALTPTEVNILYNEQLPKYQYTCTFPAQASAPTSAKVLDRTVTTTEASDVYDDTTGKFTKTYNKIQQQGRAFKWKVTADDGVEVSKITIPMNKL